MSYQSARIKALLDAVKALKVPESQDLVIALATNMLDFHMDLEYRVSKLEEKNAIKESRS